jgi:hypothetical protein
MGMDWILGVCGPTERFNRPWISPDVQSEIRNIQKPIEKPMGGINVSGITSYVSILFNKRNFK